MEQTRLKTILQLMLENIENDEYKNLETLLKDMNRLLYDQKGNLI